MFTPIAVGTAQDNALCFLLFDNADIVLLQGWASRLHMHISGPWGHSHNPSPVVLCFFVFVQDGFLI